MQPGKWTAVSCTARWDKGQDYAQVRKVTNYLGETKYSEEGRDEFARGLFKVATDDVEEYYASGESGNTSTQNCFIVANFYNFSAGTTSWTDG